MKVLKYSLFFGLGVAMLGYIASPYWVLQQIHQAYENNQAGQISKYIDYTAVKASLRPQIEQRVEQNIKLRALPENLQILGGQLSQTVSDRIVDVIVNPQTLSLLLQGKALKKAGSYQDLLNSEATVLEQYADQDSGQPLLRQNTREMAHESKTFEQIERSRYTAWNTFEVNVARTTFVMQRAGLSWKIVAIQLA